MEQWPLYHNTAIPYCVKPLFDSCGEIVLSRCCHAGTRVLRLLCSSTSKDRTFPSAMGSAGTDAEKGGDGGDGRDEGARCSHAAASTHVLKETVEHLKNAEQLTASLHECKVRTLEDKDEMEEQVHTLKEELRQAHRDLADERMAHLATQKELVDEKSEHQMSKLVAEKQQERDRRDRALLRDAAAPDCNAAAGEEPAGATPQAGGPADGAGAATPETAALPRPGCESAGPDGGCSPCHTRVARGESTDLSEADTLQSDADDSAFAHTAASNGVESCAARVGRGPTREAQRAQCNRGTCTVLGKCICGDPSPVRSPQDDADALRAGRSRAKLGSEWSHSL